MKKTFLLAALVAAPTAQAEVIAFWDFNDGFTFENEVPQIAHAASIGNGVLHQQRADTDGNGKGGITFIDAANGINNTGSTNERAMAWNDISKSGDNDAEFFITLNTSGFENLTLSFDIQGDNDPMADPADRPISFDLKYDTNPLVEITTSPSDPDIAGPVQDFDGGFSTTIFNNQALPANDQFQRFSFDLSSFTAINGQSTLALRLDDFAEGNGEARIDNVLITGTAVPEPSSALLALVGLTVLARRRR